MNLERLLPCDWISPDHGINANIRLCPRRQLIEWHLATLRFDKMTESGAAGSGHPLECVRRVLYTTVQNYFTQLWA
jgi:hypothetical protein